jgi:aldehyde:ferredoxin oxidoreductase
MYGYNGKYLRINLKTKEVKVETLDLDLAKKYIGGRGLGTKFMMDEVDPKVEALSPENKLMVVTGPLTGTATPTGGRYMVVTKSPLTGTIASSNSGGFFGAELKFAGYDMVIFEDQADSPVYVNIVDDKVEILPADNLWGKLVGETTDMLLEKHGEKAKVMVIGPAGENQSKLAAIMNCKDRAAGRSGVGAVMGSKNLKAMVVKGSNKVAIKDEDGLKSVFKDSIKKIRENGVTGEGLPTYGTAVLVNIINENGVYPYKNFQGCVDEKADDISGETLRSDYLVKNTACYRCPIACGRWVKVDGEELAGPEYETLWAFGSDCGINDLKEVIMANHWCNELGLDTISCGTTLAAAMELRQLDIVKAEEIEGEPLEFGNAKSIVEWTKKMAYREGFGDKLAEGSYRLAEMYGRPDLSMTVKKQELPAYDPRGIQGQGLQYATSNRGGCHVRGYLISPEILGLPEKLDKNELEGKAFWAKAFQDLTAVIDSLGLCLFTSFALGADDYASLINAVVGTEHDGDSIFETGDRIWNIEKLFNLESGVAPSEDKLPRRLLEDGIPEGPSKGMVTKLDQLLPEYYELRGWSEEGLPTQAKLEALGIK